METQNNKAIKFLAIFLAALTYCGAVIYGDVMFISVMHGAFPDGIMGTLATAGAVMTAISAITLPLALHWWFSPGKQFVWGIIFWLLDIAVLSLNAILAYQLSTSQPDSLLISWQMFTPATPLFAVFGWGLAFMLDPSHSLRHAQAELELDQIETYTKALKTASKGDAVYSTIEQGAVALARDYSQRLANIRLPEAKPQTGRELTESELAELLPNDEEDTPYYALQGQVSALQAQMATLLEVLRTQPPKPTGEAEAQRKPSKNGHKPEAVEAPKA